MRHDDPYRGGRRVRRKVEEYDRSHHCYKPEEHNVFFFKNLPGYSTSPLGNTAAVA
jgi:hypothetical protein